MSRTTEAPPVIRSVKDESQASGEAIGESPGVEVLTGNLEGVDDEGRLLFRREGSGTLVPVSVGVSLPDEDLLQASALGLRGLVIRSRDPDPQMVLIGLVRERVTNPSREAGVEERTASLDGKTVSLTANRRMELVCGKARIVLHQDGRIELSGTKVITRSRGSIKLKGATVEIN